MILTLLEAELRRDEGVRYSIYLDTAGIPTVGVGHNCQVSPLPTGWTCPLTDAQVNQLLANDIASTLAKLDRNLPWWRGMDEVRQRVVANLAFNLGIGTLLTFKNTLAAMQRGSYSVAAAGMLNSKWATQVGARATRLARAMETGVMPAV
ncbi:glycoside hydrolase family protein [Burkholderia gladioli pv. gladioli]|uniref:glycoside hydrolase family protein n=1 Tax=Burkholderia gladioli TaxID=28095 RepID=UPI0024BD2E7F|nr:glycoside hydrolase family protein [Burkholderia gladioli]MDJ1160766.1 glycoside hydrolase family protein [Burkholderia gladioli pv. gladioli]